MEWIEPLAYIAGAVVVIVVECLVKRFTGYWLPPKIKAALFQVVNILVANKLKKKIDDSDRACYDRFSNYAERRKDL